MSDNLYLEDTFKEIDRLTEFYMGTKFLEITPKPFSVERISETGSKILDFKKREKQIFSGTFFTPAGAGVLMRTLFYPFGISINGEIYFMELKGYGANGGNLTLTYHCDGDANFGMFYKNAKKEYHILDKASLNGLNVPKPILLGKFDREVVVDSGLKNYAFLITSNEQRANEDIINKKHQELKKFYEQGLENLEAYLKEILPKWAPIAKDPITILKQPYNLGIVVRGPKSPIRLGDPSTKYLFIDKNIEIAKSCGRTFIQLIELGYLHLTPSPGNWTLAGELTDMCDCYDLKKDKNLCRIIENREKEIKKDFWEDLIGPRHTSNLYPFFIEGMFGEQISLEEAAEEVKNRVEDKLV